MPANELTSVQIDLCGISETLIRVKKLSSRTKRPTQKSIANSLGFSVSAVSRALSGDIKIAERTRLLVEQKALELGYEPDRAATRLRTGKTNVISLILPPHDELLSFGTSLIRGISLTLEDTSYYLVIRPDFGLDNGFTSIKRVVENNQADGVILSRTEPNDIRVRYLLEKDFPFVTHGRTQLATSHAYVDFDNYQFAYSAVEAIVKEQVSDIVILLPPEQLMFHNHIHRGFRQACEDFQVSGTVLQGADLDCPPEEVAHAVRREFINTKGRRGLILPGDTSALAAMAVLHDLGLSVSEDVSLVVKQTSGIFAYVRPLVHSAYEDVTTAGRIMTEFLLKRIEGGHSNDMQEILPSDPINYSSF